MKKIFLDTDMASDCDDAGALALLHNLARLGEAEILGVTHCTSDINGSVTIRAINDWFGKARIPIGQYEKDGFLCGENSDPYVSAIAKEYLKDRPMPEFEGAVKTLRRCLAQNDGVTLVAIGPLNNIADLLKSPPDDISALSGVELVRRAVEKAVVMGGHFEDGAFFEFNIRCDIPAAQYVAQNCPVPVIYCGYETGLNVLTGHSLPQQDEKYPVRQIYRLFGKALNQLDENGVFRRHSWDLLTAYYAVRGPEDLWAESAPVTVSFDERGGTRFSKGGKDRYLINTASGETIADRLESLIGGDFK